MTRIGIAGISGRMGREIVAAAAVDPAIEVAAGVERAEVAAAAVGLAPVIVTDATEALARIDVLIDFTSPDVAAVNAAACAAAGVGFVCGVTGLGPEHIAALHTAAERIPVFYARNMSLGVSALIEWLPAIVRVLSDYDIEIVEMHHRHKSDAPSGTAMAIAEAIAGARHQSLSESARYGREGHAPRDPGELGIHAVRGGGNAGEHTVIIADEGEEIRISHRALSRRTFALGALRAARFTAGRPPGFLTMADLLTPSAPILWRR